MTGLAPVASAHDAQSGQWYLEAMKAEEMWEVSTGEGIKVAVIDSGVDPSSPSLSDRVLPGKDFSRAPGDENDDDDGHGTTMAELIAGSGKDGTLKGLAPDAKIIPYRTTLVGMKGADTEKDHLGEAIRAAADSDAQIISMSLGGAPYPKIKTAVEYAAKKGKLLFAAMGNEGDGKNELNYPAAYPDVAGVAALDRNGKVAKYSTHGEETTLSGPGVDIPGWCDAKLERYCSQGGTSAATAIASASAALIWSKHPKWTSNQVLRVLMQLGDHHNDPSKYVGYGAVRPRLNLLENKGDPGDPDISPLTGERTLHTKPDKPKSHSKDSAKGDAPDKVKVADSQSGDGNGWVLPAVGIAAGIVILAGCGFAVVRLRRN
ncbi:S8 family serine peptidase [Streptomyces albus]|uniref:S8 family serine peptidase n=1 Tax=Streptomyces sp. NRRL F-5639 TaxID=1463867 RepID=UPI001F1BC222|nr:S8 family serine peptidase [Streptomyces sp. NRRL F-5639]